MERAELITHLEHLAEYVKYSEDAPALREAIEILKCSEIPNSSKDFFWKNARKNARKYTETHACDLIERETARRIIDSPRTKEQMLRMLESMPPVQSDHIAEVSKKVDADLISRQATIEVLRNRWLKTRNYEGIGEDIAEECEIYLKTLPSAQPQSTMGQQTETVQSTNDLISRQTVRQKLTALVNELEEIFSDIRESNVDDSVCGLCEYDGAYIGQSGDWCNECPGFDRDDCFKLKEKYREEWLKIDG